jgi:hypothetical protein
MTATSAPISGLPTDGRTLYARLWSQFGGAWSDPNGNGYYVDYTYFASAGNLPLIASPPNHSAFSSSTVGAMEAAETAEAGRRYRKRRLTAEEEERT